MQPEQEKPISQIEKAKEGIRKEKETGTIRMPGGAGGRNKKFHELGNFKRAKQRLEETGKLDRNDFNSGQELGMFIDWYNKALEEAKRARGDNEIHEISKFLGRIVAKSPKSIFLGNKKVIK